MIDLTSQSVEDGEIGHAVYSESSLPPERITKVDSNSDVTEFQILKSAEIIEPSYRPDGGFGNLSPEEVKAIKERVTAEFYLTEQNNHNPHPNGPIPETMTREDEDDEEEGVEEEEGRTLHQNNSQNETETESQIESQSVNDSIIQSYSQYDVVELEEIKPNVSY